jgi:alanyl-tRNA synthetase
VADTQKCLRVSGKHNDLEEVGVDTYHHTMFEMLGNWSFGDYFKADAIAWCWELLTVVYGLPKDRLYVTVFQGDEKEGLPRDEEAIAEWKKWIAEDRILMGNKKDNFWEMGDTGPCGPCTEVHVDGRPDAERATVDGKTLVNADHPQVIEIWNNVFMQFNRLKSGELEPLPEKHVDTGMGLERLVRVIQGKTSNYDTDLFTSTISEVERITALTYRYGNDRADIAFRVMADHLRAIAFSIADGQLPSNTGAGYVIRRILRRAVRYYYSYLNYTNPLLHQLIPGLAAQFSHVFPELQQQQDFVRKVVQEEEESFLRTLEKGLRKMDDLTKETEKTIKGSEAFELLDTYGFPIDLTRLIAREKGFTVDEAGFEKEMQQQKERSRAATAVDADDWVILREDASSVFIGYDHLDSITEVVKYRKVKGKGKEAWQVVLAKTPFYAESGGQAGDTGLLEIAGKTFAIADTRKENDLIIHLLPEIPGSLEGPVIARVDVHKRKQTAMHHSATHLLHAALRKVLGTHVAQKGSLVNDQYLRFDFSHFSKVTPEEIQQVAALVNEKIRENSPVVIKEMPKDEAIALGAMALFGEKYGDMVRVVIMDPAYSVELCGGTHVGSTGELGFFVLTSESAVAAGVRRVEALAGQAAAEFIESELGALRYVKELFRNPKDLEKAVEQLQDENTSLKKQIESLEARMLTGMKTELMQKVEAVGDSFFLGQTVEVPHADALKKLCFDLRSQLPDHLIVLAANIGGKASIAVGISDALVKSRSLDAGKIIKEIIAPLIKGGGGGQKTLATAGGQDTSKLTDVLLAVRNLL